MKRLGMRGRGGSRSHQMLRMVGVDPPDIEKPAPVKKRCRYSTQNFGKGTPANGVDEWDSDASSVSSFTGSELNGLNSEWVSVNLIPKLGKKNLEENNDQKKKSSPLKKKRLVDYTSSPVVTSSSFVGDKENNDPGNKNSLRERSTPTANEYRDSDPAKSDDGRAGFLTFLNSFNKLESVVERNTKSVNGKVPGKQENGTLVTQDESKATTANKTSLNVSRQLFKEPSETDQDSETSLAGSEVGQNLTPYQRLRLKTVQANEVALAEVLKGSPASVFSSSSFGRTSSQKKGKVSFSPTSFLSSSSSNKVNSSRKRKCPVPVKPSKTKPVRVVPERKSGRAARKLLKDCMLPGSSDGVDDAFVPLPSDDDTDSKYEESDSSDESHHTLEDLEANQTPPVKERAATVHFPQSEEEKDVDDPQAADPNLADNYEGGEENPDQQGNGEVPLQENEEEDPDQQDNEPKRKESDLKADRKVKRNSGKQYVRRNGDIVPERSKKLPHKCKRNKCNEVVTPEIGDIIFEEYWAQGNFDKRVRYVAARIEKHHIQRKRPRLHDSHREKSQSVSYYFDYEGSRIKVCRETFLGTLGETDRFVRDVVDNKHKSTSGIPGDDKRGRKAPKHALPQAKKHAVLEHIKSFPAYVSHYCRAQTKQLYLSSELNVKLMYELYKEESLPEVSYDTYRKIFKTTGRKFHAPKTDGCDTCDKLDIQIAAAAGEEKTKLEKIKELHLRKAEKGYALKREAKAISLTDDTQRVLIFDLQQCLPTPHLRCKSVYYARQMYVYNFTIYDPKTDVTHCYMWSEVEGHRGSNEMASCLLKHIIEEVPEGVTEIKLFSDCCSGQNRNSTVATAMIVALQEHPTISAINHIFLISGHTFMPEVDNKHSIIERYKKKLEKINVPSEWYEVVKKAGMTDKKNYPDGKFKVVHMTEFYDLTLLVKGPLVKRTICMDRQKVDYLGAHWMRYEKDSLGCVMLKNSLNEEASFRIQSFLRRGTRSDHLPQLKPLLKTTPDGLLPISEEKKTDLLNLLPYLDEEYRDFYRNLPTTKGVQNFLPNEVPVEEDGEEDEEEEDNL